MPRFHGASLLLVLASTLTSVGTALSQDPAASRGAPWARHTIDNSSRGADGVKLADVNNDGLPDVVTGWEEGGLTRLYLQPRGEAVKRPWPAVTVGQTPSVEDAVFVDLDADGRVDVVTCCEGRTRRMFVHWAPPAAEDYLDPNAWTTQPIPDSVDRMMWMFCVPAQIDGRRGVDLFAGGKGAGCQIGWFESPANARDLEEWKWRPIDSAGWIMTLAAVDFNGDGRPDVLATDRKGPKRSCRWLENPGMFDTSHDDNPWTSHLIGGRDRQVMFATLADLDDDGHDDVVCATYDDSGILFFRRRPAEHDTWETFSIAMPSNVGTGKAVAAPDVDLDGRPDLILSCGNSHGEKSGVTWLSFDGFPGRCKPTYHEISGPVGIKFDRMELLDLDADGDLDLLTCEESEPVEGKRRGLGVFWYENPTR